MPDDVRVDLHAQLQPYRRAFTEVRWTKPESWHLTLLFLGSVAPDRVPELRALIDDIASRVKPFDAVVDLGGGRIQRQEGVAWLGLSQGAGELMEAASLTAAACPSDIAHGRPPKRTPSAHLTVARRADAALVRALRERSFGPLGMGWRVERVELVRSHLEPGGARYETLHESTM